jgi:hypothetical protein
MQSSSNKEKPTTNTVKGEYFSKKASYVAPCPVGEPSIRYSHFLCY